MNPVSSFVKLTAKVKARLRALLSAIGKIRPLVPLLYAHGVRDAIAWIPGTGSLYGFGWNRRHPFDRLNGTDTSGVVEVENLGLEADHPARGQASPYAGSQPSIIRAAIHALPPLSGATFVDLGCGKGRPLLVAAEFPFREIIGVELSAQLAQIARDNAAIIAARRGRRPRIHIEVADASRYPIPPGEVVLFTYHSFGAPIVANVVSAIAAAIKNEDRAIYIIYYNPVNGRLFDASPFLTRRWARMVPCSREERGYGADEDDAVVIWQGGTAPAPPSPADSEILVKQLGTRAELGERKG